MTVRARPMHPPYGPQPMGVVTFSVDRRMAAVVCDGRTSLPSGKGAREYNSYCGAYTFDGATLVTRVDACSDPARMGSDQVRGVRFEGTRLVLMPPPRPVAGRDAAPRAVLGKSRVRLASDLQAACKRLGRLDAARGPFSNDAARRRGRSPETSWR